MAIGTHLATWTKARRTGWILAGILLLGLSGIAITASLPGSSVKLTPLSLGSTPDSSLPAEVQQLESQTVPHLFDRNTTTEYTA
ncbi:MAG: hypothetical protein OEZ39_20020, partial [Gammaproteobacteria bacterium]|nr:hypothetical protein [Gammaproteobacteria bacterium]